MPNHPLRDAHRLFGCVAIAIALGIAAIGAVVGLVL